MNNDEIDGKIYKIQYKDNNDICYIGSTTKTLVNRMGNHIRCFKNNSSHYSLFELFEKYGVDNFEIILLEKYTCKNKDELRKKEGEYIESLDCVNRVIAGRSKHEYAEQNKEKIKEYMKKYEQDNIESLRSYRQNYAKVNKDKISSYKKDY